MSKPAQDIQQVRFEEVTPANEYVGFFDVSIESLAANLDLPIFEGYDDLDYLRFTFLTLPSGENVTLGQYPRSPQPGTYLYVVAITSETSKIVAESCQQLTIAKEEIIWVYPDFQNDFDLLYSSHGNFPRQHEKPQIEGDFVPSGLYEPIDCFQYALQIYTRQKFPEHWAMIQHNLGLAYYNRVKGAKRQNLEESIKCFNNSQQIYTKQQFPEKWKINQDNISDSQELIDSQKKLASLELSVQTDIVGEYKYPRQNNEVYLQVREFTESEILEGKIRNKSRDSLTNKIFTKPSLIRSRRKNQRRHFLLWCAGVDIDILTQNIHYLQEEHRKYLAIGLNICLSTTVAFFAAFHSTLSLFGGYVIALAYGIFWSALVFVVNRFTIMNVKKNQSSDLSSAVRNSICVFLSILMASIIAFPLQIAVFSPEIDAQISANNSISLVEDMRKDYALRQTEDNLQNTNTEIINKVENIKILENEIIKELTGANGTRIPGRVYFYVRIQNSLKEQEAKKDVLTVQRKKLLESKIERIEILTRNRDKVTIGSAEKLNILVQILIERPIAMLTSCLMIILVAVIELAPIAINFSLKSNSLYDYILASREKELLDQIELENERRISELQIERKLIHNKFP